MLNLMFKTNKMPKIKDYLVNYIYIFFGNLFINWIYYIIYFYFFKYIMYILIIYIYLN